MSRLTDYIANASLAIQFAPDQLRPTPPPPPPGHVTVVGTVWPDTGLPPLVGADVWDAGWPKRVQRLGVQRMAELTGAAPLEIRLEPASLVRTWLTICLWLSALMLYVADTVLW